MKMAKEKTSRLGTGLSALFGEDENVLENETVQTLPISRVEPRKDQPRRDFDPAAIEELAASIREYGLIQPITVRPLDKGYYQIIAGERRWRAAKSAGLDQVPAVIIEADDRKVMELGLIENLQREDLNPVEEAQGYQVLMEEYGLTQEEQLSAGHARAILAAPSADLQRQAAKQVLEHQLSVRQTEALIKALQKGEKPPKEPERPDLALYLGEVEKSLSSSLGRKVTISHKGKKGRIQLEYYDDQDLESLLALLQQRDGGEVESL